MYLYDYMITLWFEIPRWWSCWPTIESWTRMLIKDKLPPWDLSFDVIIIIIYLVRLWSRVPFEVRWSRVIRQIFVSPAFVYLQLPWSRSIPRSFCVSLYFDIIPYAILIVVIVHNGFYLEALTGDQTVDGYVIILIILSGSSRRIMDWV